MIWAASLSCDDGDAVPFSRRRRASCEERARYIEKKG